jgi:hypothetical protein
MSDTYAEYEFNKLTPGGARIKVTADKGGETRWISVTDETLAKVLSALKGAPECSWGVPS